MFSGNFANNKHSVGINAFHLEWCTKYRYKLLHGSIVNRVLRESICATSQQYGMQILAMEIGFDHIHLFVSLPSTMAVSTALQLFKGRSSREIFAACRSFRGLYHKGHFWSRGIFYRSVSNVCSSTVYNYISQHKTRELQNTIYSAKSEASQLSLLNFF
ncbi:Transposase IS200 like protein [Candidatus Gugararchaeum adminiculabundum]|nr:Transposase IS200 like protein [Candidatus Gugararchaeum adminiculabundum]